MPKQAITPTDLVAARALRKQLERLKSQSIRQSSATEATEYSNTRDGQE